MIETRAAQRTTVHLPDGSRIVLAPFSRLSYDAQFSTRQREVRLTGLAYFEIVHDSARPFLVQAGGSTTRVLGTRFSVRAYDDERVVRVAVEEGHVALGGNGSRRVTELRRGDVGERAESGAVRVSTLTSARSSTEWTRERLVFDSMLVSEVLAEVGRWYGLQIRVADSTLLRRHLSTTLANDDADRALDVLALALDVHVVRDTHTVILRRIK
jgi:transmembrane sensor